MIYAVIFDLDGVLVSTDEMHFAAWKQLGTEIGITNFTREDNQRQRGVSRMESLDVLLEKSGNSYTESEKQVLAEKKNGYYVQLLNQLSPNDLLPGALETIKGLRDRGIQIALGSASKNAQLIVKKTSIESLFDVIVDGHDTKKSKPNPEVFLLAAQKLKIEPEKCLVVEDADAGISAARAANMTSLGVGPAKDNSFAQWHGQNLADPQIDWNAILA